MRQQDVIKSLVQEWAKSHHAQGGDFGSFVTLLWNALGNLDVQGNEDRITKLYNYLGGFALWAVPEWKDAPLDPEILEEIEDLLED